VFEVHLARYNLPVSGFTLQGSHSSQGVHHPCAGMGSTLFIHGVSLLPYLDDWILTPDRPVLLHHHALVLQTLDVAGFTSHSG
jgi:hypothetical protein